MTDEEYRQQVQKRWQESMALLGFEDSGPEPLADVEQPAKEVPGPAQPASLTESDPDEESPGSTSAPHPAEPYASPTSAYEEWDGIQEEQAAVVHTPMPKPTPQTEAVDLTAEPPAPVVEVQGGGEDQRGEKEPLRRRRGRRGRGRRSEGGESERQHGQGEESGRHDEETSERQGSGRRGRGRSRQRVEDSHQEEEAADLEESATEEAADDSDFPDDEQNDFSDWNVPSWQELIASLYRPER
jgi:ribonuclease E